MQPPQGEGDAPPPKKDSQTQQIADIDKENRQNEGNIDSSKQHDNELYQKDMNKASSSTCRPVATHRPKVEFSSHRINARIQFMRDHALIGKFIGIWPTERALRSWISTKWKPKGHITLHLGPKGFFIAIFNCLEDRNRILDGGPYFFNFAGLYLKGWVERFNPDKEDLNYAPVWIRLYSLPWE